MTQCCMNVVQLEIWLINDTKILQHVVADFQSAVWLFGGLDGV